MSTNSHLPALWRGPLAFHSPRELIVRWQGRECTAQIEILNFWQDIFGFRSECGEMHKVSNGSRLPALWQCPLAFHSPGELIVRWQGRECTVQIGTLTFFRRANVC